MCKGIGGKTIPRFYKVLHSYECMNTFMEKYKIPEVIGCVDDAHFGLQRRSNNEHTFFNRRAFHSLNSMVICHHEYKILAINFQYGNDSFVWKHSAERNFLKELHANNTAKNVWVLGDCGYPLEPWCITPYRNPAEGSADAYFKDVHSKASVKEDGKFL